MFNKKENKEPMLKKKQRLDLSFFKRNIYLVVIGLILLLGTSFSLTFFIQNKKIGEVTLTIGDITYTVTQDRSISINNLKMNVPNNEGLLGFSKEITIRNTSNLNGKLELKINRTSGVPLEGLRYGLYINDVLIDVADMPSDGIIYHSAILGNEQVKTKVVLWIQEDYSTSETSFVGNIEEKISLDSMLASTYLNSLNNLNNNYVKFNDNETWRIKGVEEGSLVVTKTADLNNTFANSNLFNVSNTLTDDSLVVSMSTDNKAYYLKKTVKIVSGTGTESNPYVLENNVDDIEDRKIVGYITYNNQGTNLTPRQPIYYGETNYIGMAIDTDGFQGWSTTSSGDVDYKLGDTFNINSNTTLYAKFRPLTAIETIAQNVDTTTQINFADASSDTNGKGLYILPGTENDTNPIYYYRGAIDNNNVVFAGFCWQIVRTTETGGIKMIYNGLPDIEGTGDNITYNCGTTRDIQDTIRTTIDLVETTGYYYADDYEIVSTTGNSVTYKLKAGTNGIHQVAIANETDAATNIPTIVANYPYTCLKTTEDETCTNIYKVDSYASGTNANVYSSLDRTIIGRSAFNSQYTSVSDVGYMYNQRYPYSTSGWKTNALFGSAATWVTDHYELTDASVTTPDTTHHYSCNETTSDATCTSLRYVYYVSGTTKRYITLTNGDLIEDALYKMTGNGSDAVKQRNNSYVLNQNNSTAKVAIDNWFRTNLTDEDDASKPNYEEYLEDAIYCNDRSFKTTGSSNTYTQSGWNPNGGDLSTTLYFGTHNRYSNSYYSTTNVPSMTCPNESDRFTKDAANGNGALTYPIGLLTADEIILAGVGGNNSSTSTYYLYTNDWYWSLSPYCFYTGYAYGFNAKANLGDNRVPNSNGLRPVVSLRPGTEFESGGNGEATSPFVVKYS